MTDNSQIITSNGVDLCVEARGEPANPPLLLIHGAAASMKGWPDDFYEALVDGGLFVIRYDHRDTGRSTGYPPGAPPYSLRDLARDALGILDHFNIERAHVAGISMGGGIAQILAIEHSDRVRSLIQLATSPGGPDLPPPTPEFLEFVGNPAQPDWSDTDAVIEHVLDMFRVFSGNERLPAESRMRAMLEADIERSTVHPTSTHVNHFLVGPGETVHPRLSEITAPTLVIHGEDDPVFPVEHARVLTSEIPYAELRVLSGVAHLIPWEACAETTAAMLKHIEGVV